jgi:hypothetical protein
VVVGLLDGFQLVRGRFQVFRDQAARLKERKDIIFLYFTGFMHLFFIECCHYPISNKTPHVLLSAPGVQLSVLLQSVSLENLFPHCLVHKMRTCVQTSVADPDPHHFGKLDLHQSGKLDPDPDPHQSERNPDPHQSEKVEILEGHFSALEGLSLGKSEFCSRIQIKLKGRIPIRINVMRIRNTGTERDTAGKYNTINNILL